MKKNLLWMFAAILLCGLTITMFTACGGDDEDTRPNSEQQGGDEGDDPSLHTTSHTQTAKATKSLRKSMQTCPTNPYQNWKKMDWICI